MSTEFPVAIPDIGDFEDVEVIEVLVAVGDTVEEEEPLITLESDKAAMDIPAPRAGRVAEILVTVGDKVSAGSIIATIDTAETKSATTAKTTPYVETVPSEDTERSVSEGHLIATIAAVSENRSDGEPAARAVVGAEANAAVCQAAPGAEPTVRPVAPEGARVGPSSRAYASPSIRKFARELGVDLTLVSGTGRKGRIIKSDVQAFVESAISDSRTSAPGGLAFTQSPAVDFSKFGPVETQVLSKIKRLTGQNLHRSWISVPHVTQFDEADITELEAFRKSKLADAQIHGVKLTLLAFLLKALVVVLNKYPDFNASLSADGASIIHKKYFHIGMAVHTERGLVVPVIKNADQKGLYELAGEIRELSVKARNKQLKPMDMQGGCFTISSLGGVGGTAFTPIINTPEVAILGISPSVMKPVYSDGEFIPRLMLPYALSFDHRVVDGVAGAEFTRHLGVVLSDIRHILL